MNEAKKIPRQQVLKRVNELRNAGKVKIRDHWKDRSKKRGFDLDDFRSILNHGYVEDGEWDEKHKNYKYRIIGRDVEKKDFTVVLAIEADRLILISGMRKERGRWEPE